MGNLGHAFKRAAKAFADSLGPGQYEAGGKLVTCPHCGSAEFAEGHPPLSTAGMGFLGLDWTHKSATTLACTNCGYIHWFLRPPTRK